MSEFADAETVEIRLEAGRNTAFLLLLTADGRIHRIGTGEGTNTDQSLFMGVTEKRLFDELMKQFDPAILAGESTETQPLGVPHQLSIELTFPNGPPQRVRFRYDSEATNLPDEVTGFVRSAVQLTNPWFYEQKKIVDEAASREGLHLPKTRLRLIDGVIRRYGSDNGQTASFPLDTLRDIRCEKSNDYIVPPVMACVLITLAVLAKTYIPSVSLGWIAMIICGGSGLLLLIGIFGRKIVLETDSGSISYPVQDNNEEAEGFALSVRQQLNQELSDSNSIR